MASGDLTNRGRAEQHAAAAAFLRGARPAGPRRPRQPRHPVHVSRSLHEDLRRVRATLGDDGAGVQLAHAAGRRTQLGPRLAAPVGRHSRAAAARTGELFAQAAPGALRVAVLHHHLIGAPWRSRKKPVSRRSHVLAGLVDAGAELILAGHIHQGAVSERHEFEVIHGDVRGAIVSIAPGLGQPRPQRRGEARGLHVYECTEVSIRVETYIWRDNDWGLTAVRRFARGREPLIVEPAEGPLPLEVVEGLAQTVVGQSPPTESAPQAVPRARPRALRQRTVALGVPRRAGR